MQQYSIILPSEKAATYRYVSLFILLINMLAFGFFYFSSTEETRKNICLSAAITSFISLVLFFINALKKKLIFFRTEFLFFLISIFWLVLGSYLVAFCMMLFAVVCFYTNRKFEVIFTSLKIIYPSFPKKTFFWSEVSNIMLKDSVLTIDLKNNKLIQVVISTETAETINENSFNEFCHQQLSGNV